MSALIFSSIIGVFSIFLAGNFFHFIYPLSGKRKIISLFGSVNESTWEHLKIAFWPFLIFMYIENLFLGDEFQNIVFFRSLGILFTLIFIPLLYYSYKYLLGKRKTIIDISVFFVSILVGILLSSVLMTSVEWVDCDPVGYFISSVLVLIFLLGTTIPPKIFLFKDPISGGYGVSE